MLAMIKRIARSAEPCAGAATCPLYRGNGPTRTPRTRTRKRSRGAQVAANGHACCDWHAGRVESGFGEQRNYQPGFTTVSRGLLADVCTVQCQRYWASLSTAGFQREPAAQERREYVVPRSKRGRSSSAVDCGPYVMVQLDLDGTSSEAKLNVMTGKQARSSWLQLGELLYDWVVAAVRSSSSTTRKEVPAGTWRELYVAHGGLNASGVKACQSIHAPASGGATAGCIRERRLMPHGRVAAVAFATLAVIVFVDILEADRTSDGVVSHRHGAVTPCHVVSSSRAAVHTAWRGIAVAQRTAEGHTEMGNHYPGSVRTIPPPPSRPELSSRRH